ncbi:hypothetical protein [Bartonella sp. ML70XJBT]|uniref:hypothetical protein n=1 Tax=Bartonella sp. ML70XJBT TaxID=3019096 RepID=UPI00235EF620|nr:hypothetical protein [Bartonella sp. ML70XJBT]
MMRIEIRCRARFNFFQFEGILKLIDAPLASVHIEHLSWSVSIVRFRRQNTLFYGSPYCGIEGYYGKDLCQLKNYQIMAWLFHKEKERTFCL